MRNLRQILQVAYPILLFERMLINKVWDNKKGKLRVLICHDIPPNGEKRFASLLNWLSQSWNFVSPGRFGQMIQGEFPIKGNNLLLTFDDGFRSNAIVAESVLKSMKIKALFFVVSDFINIENKNEAKHFITQNIQPGISVNRLPKHLFNMKWEDLAILLENGHTIGAHTKTHVRLSDIQENMFLGEEIIESANDIEKHLGISIEHFAFTFGDLASITPEALNKARNQFKYIYTGLRGGNEKNVPPWAIRRDVINLEDSKWLIGSLLFGLADRLYANDLIAYESWKNKL